MNVLADIMASVATTVAAEGSTYSAWLIFDEPECPEELL